MKSQTPNVRTLTHGSMMAALVFVATYFFKLPVSVTQGYIHLGDGFILLGAALLGNLVWKFSLMRAECRLIEEGKKVSA